MLFDFDKVNWSEHPQIVIQKCLPYGVTQSGTYLQLALDEVANSVDHPTSNLIISNFCIVDNLLFLFQSPAEMHEVAGVIKETMVHHSLPLQQPSTTSNKYHPDFKEDHPSEVVLGYLWCKVQDTIVPNIVLSHGRKSKGKKGIKWVDQPISARNISKKIIISLMQQLWDPLGFFFDIFEIAMKILNNKVCLAMPGNYNF